MMLLTGRHLDLGIACKLTRGATQKLTDTGNWLDTRSPQHLVSRSIVR
jgi:hypothetical protein